MYTVRLPTVLDGGVQSNSKVTAPAVPRREPLCVCSMYSSAMPLVVHALPKAWLRKLVCVQTSCVYPSAPAAKVPACVLVLLAWGAVSWNPQRLSAESVMFTTRCCLAPGV